MIVTLNDSMLRTLRKVMHEETEIEELGENGLELERMGLIHRWRGHGSPMMRPTNAGLNAVLTGKARVRAPKNPKPKSARTKKWSTRRSSPCSEAGRALQGCRSRPKAQARERDQDARRAAENEGLKQLSLDLARIQRFK